MSLIGGAAVLSIMKPIVIIPVYNEEETIRDVLGELCRHYSGDVLIVNDGSTDASMARIHSCILKRPVSVIDHNKNLGYGGRHPSCTS